MTQASQDSTITIVRSDRIGLYSRNNPYDKALSHVPVPLMAATYGDLLLTEDGSVAFAKVSWYDQAWTSHIDQMSAADVPLLQAMSCYQGVSPKLLLDVSAGERKFYVLFTGIVRFNTKTENLFAKIPGIHHAGAFAVAAKSAVHNRGSKDRAIESRRVWKSVLNGQMRPTDAAQPPST